MIILQDNHPPERTSAPKGRTVPRAPNVVQAESLQATGPQPAHPQTPWILLLSPLFVAVTVAILLGLLGIFVAWLLVVSALVSAIVVSDIAHRSWRVFARAQGNAFQHRAAGYP